MIEDDDRLVSPVSGGDDEEHVQASLRPRSLAEFIGQTREKRKLSIAIQAARGRNEPLDHLLLHGPPGLGKTTLSNIVVARDGRQPGDHVGPGAREDRRPDGHAHQPAGR